jgi:hypothetical protein
MRTLMMIGLAVGLLSLPLSASAAVHKSSARAKRTPHARMVKHAKAKSKRSRAAHATNLRHAPAKAHRV